MIYIIFLIFLIIFIFYFFSSNFKEINNNFEYNEPTLTDTTKEIFYKDGCKITPLKEINFNTRILSKTKYSNLKDSFIVPYDIVFGWNNMVKKEYLDKINISQSNRWFFYDYKNNSLFNENDIRSNFDNFHIIPENQTVLEKIDNLSIGDTVYIKGYLVNLDCSFINFKRGSSLSFTDRSATSCEQILIEDIKELN